MHNLSIIYEIISLSHGKPFPPLQNPGLRLRYIAASCGKNQNSASFPGAGIKVAFHGTERVPIPDLSPFLIFSANTHTHTHGNHTLPPLALRCSGPKAGSVFCWCVACRPTLETSKRLWPAAVAELGHGTDPPVRKEPVQ